jgi:hypothetical protein
MWEETVGTIKNGQSRDTGNINKFMLPVSLDCPFLIVPTVSSHIYLCCLCLLIVHSWLSLQFPLTYIYVACVSGLSILDCPYSFLSHLFMLPVSLDCPFLIAPTVSSHIYLWWEETVGTVMNGQSRDTGNINKCERKLGAIKNGQSRDTGNINKCARKL